MRVSIIVALTVGLGKSALGESLSNALLNDYPDTTSQYRTAISLYPGGIEGLLPDGGADIPNNSSEGITVLVPTDAAFAKYLNTTNITSIGRDNVKQLTEILQYHMLYAKLNSTGLSADDGLIVPTLLYGDEYNNRTPGDALTSQYGEGIASTGAPLYVSKDPINPVRFRVRQSNGGLGARGGMAQGGLIDAVDGVWDQGYFQLMDTVLTPPQSCSATLQGEGPLTSMLTALTATNLTLTLDHTPNITCLAPSNDAFQAAGDPQSSPEDSQLTSALMFHTLPQPYYSPYLVDGMVIPSAANTNLTVRIIGEDIYFNDAKVISPNVLINNGVIHVLNKVMSPNGTAPVGSSTSSAVLPSSTSTGSGLPIGPGTKTLSETTSATASPGATNAAGLVRGQNNAFGGLLGFMVAAAVLV